MDVTCSNCNAVYELEVGQIKGESIRVKCSTCGHVFRVFKREFFPPEPLSQPPETVNDWIVRYSDGAVTHIPSLATLQKWVVERKVRPDDELSRDGKSWTRLGQVADLVSFFEVVEKLDSVTEQVRESRSPESRSALPHVLDGTDPNETLDFGSLVGSQEAQEILGRNAPKRKRQATLPLSDDKEEPEVVLASASSPTFNVSSKAGLSYDFPPKGEDSGDMASTEVEVPSVNMSMRGIQAADLEMDEAKIVEQVIGSSDSLASVEPLRDFTSMANVGGLKESNPVNGSSDSASMANTEMVEPKKGVGELGGWFVGADEIPPEPQVKPSFDSDYRDFSNYSGGEEGDELSDDELEYRPSRMGRNILFFLILCVVAVVVYWQVAPHSFYRTLVGMGLVDEHPAALVEVQSARTGLRNFTLKSFSASEKRLSDARNLQGKGFLAQEAVEGLLALQRAEYFGYQMRVFRLQEAGYKVTQAKIVKAIQRLKSDSQRASKEKRLRGLLQRNAEELRSVQTQFQTFEGMQQKQLDKARGLLQRLNALQKWDLSLKLGIFHLTALSQAPEELEKRLKKFKKLSMSGGKRRDVWAEDGADLAYASYLVRQGKFIESEPRLRKLIDRRRDWVLPRLLRAESLYRLGKLPESRAVLKNALVIEASHPLALLMQSVTQEGLVLSGQVGPTRRPPKARRTSSSGVQVSQAPEARRATPLARPVERRVSAVRPRPRPVRRPPPRPRVVSSKDMMKSANRSFRRERYRKALRLYRKLMSKKPSSFLQARMGWCLLEQGQNVAAKRAFERAIRMRGSNSDAYYGLGLAFRRMGNIALAKQTFRQYLRRFTNSREASEVRRILQNL